jgi:hypothetical protein
MNTYIQLKAEVRQGVFEHSIVPVDLNNPKSIHEAVLLFVDDLYSEDGYYDFNPEYYYQLDFDKLFTNESIIVNDNLHISLMYGIGEN